jgi:predicted alpha/beta-fold hydrolase
MTKRNYLIALTSLASAGILTKVILSLRSQDKHSEKPFLSSWKIGELPYLVAAWAKESRRLQTTALSSLVLTYIAHRFGATTTVRTSLVTFFCGLWYMEWKMRVVEVPQVTCKGTYFNRRVLSKLQPSLGKYYPCMWLSNSHFNTIGSSIIRDLEFLLYSKMHYETQVLGCYDGVNTFALDWFQPENTRRRHQTHASDTPVLVLVHGLGGSTEEAYQKKIARLCHQHGWRCASFDYWRLDFAEFRDLDIAISAIRQNNPSAPIAVCGVSAGTHIVARYLQVIGKNSPCCCAILQSSVFDMIEEYQIIKQNIKQGGAQAAVAKGYKQFVDTTIRRMAARHLKNEKRPNFDRERFQALLKQPNVNADVIYDECVWCSPERSEWPLPTSKTSENESFQQRMVSRSGDETARPIFQGNDAHYAGLAGDKMSNVKVTTLIMHAVDDPIVGYHSVDWEACYANKNIISVSTERGGHIGWLTGIIPFGPTWADVATVNFISSVLEIHSSTNFILDVVKRSGLFAEENLFNLQHRTVSSEKLARICSASDIQGELLAGVAIGGEM